MMTVPTVQLADGNKMPAIGFGTFFGLKGSFTDDEVCGAVKQAIEVGYRHIDTAWLYNTEPAIGRAIKEKIADGTVTREDLFITSKLSHAHHDLLLEGIQESLTHLGLDYLDLYLITTPMATKMPADGQVQVPVKGSFEINNENDHVTLWKDLEQLVHEGLVRSIGVSNFNSKQLQHILDNCTIKPATNQVEGHAYLANDKLIESCQCKGVTVTVYTPLGQPHRSWRPQGFSLLLEDPVLIRIAEALGRSPAQVALRYQIQKGVAVIAKSGNPERMQENFEIFDFTLSDENMRDIRALDRNQRAWTFDAYGEHKDNFLSEPF